MADIWQKIHYQGGEERDLPPGIPTCVRAPYEQWIQKDNASIVLGKDRPAGIWSGRSQESHAHSIDMVVGHYGLNTEEVSPNFKSAAARIWMCEKTDVDDPIYFDLKNNREHGGLGNPKGLSAIGMKADNIRIVAREGIKLVTGTDPYNSKNGEIVSIQGIDLVAGNYRGPNIQPLVRGSNMVNCMDRVLDYIQDLHELLYAFIDNQMKWNQQQVGWNTAIQSHTHPVVTASPLTSPSPELIAAGQTKTALQGVFGTTMATQAAGIFNEKANVTGTRNKYLRKNSKATYICSAYNNTN